MILSLILGFYIGFFFPLWLPTTWYITPWLLIYYNNYLNRNIDYSYCYALGIIIGLLAYLSLATWLFYNKKNTIVYVILAQVAWSLVGFSLIIPIQLLLALLF